MEAPKGGDICIPMADSHSCMAEANTTLQSNYPPIKNKFKKMDGTSLTVQWLRPHVPNAGSPGCIPDQGTISHTMQQRVHMLQLKNLNAATKTEDPAMLKQRPSAAK